MAEQKRSGKASEKPESETHRHNRGTSPSEGIASRKHEIAAGLSETRERGEKAVKEAEKALKNPRDAK